MTQLIKLWLFTNSPIVPDGYFIHSLTAFCTFLHIFCTSRHTFPNYLYVLIMHKMQAMQSQIQLFSLYFDIFVRFSINFDIDFYAFKVLLIRVSGIRIPAGAPKSTRQIFVRCFFVVSFKILKAIPHNSKCRYGERDAADAKPKAQIILDAAKVSNPTLSSILATQMPCRSCQSGA